MTATVPPQIVDAPEPRETRYGLLTAANGPLSLPAPHGLAGGVRYRPVGCGIARKYDTTCPPSSNPQKVFDNDAATVDRPSFIAYASMICGAAGNTPAQLEDKVRRRLLDGEQTVPEQGLAAILATEATPIAAPAPHNLISVVGELEQWLYGTGAACAAYGYTGYIHCPPRYAAEAAFDQIIVKDGQLLRTPLGTIWVFGGGYPDDGTIYATGQVTVWRSADIFVPPAESVLDRSTNQYHLLAEREYAVTYDCVAAKCEYDWTPLS